MSKISQSTRKQILTKIAKRGRGWAFSRVDFAAEHTAEGIHAALAALNRTGQIRRVVRGVYDYPRKGRVTSGDRAPDMDQVAQALARKFDWRIQPTGDAALNLVGLSTQVPARWIYSSSGPSRTYQVGARELQFRQARSREAGFQIRESGLLVQALRALGKDGVDSRAVAQLRKAMSGKPGKQIVLDTRTAPEWIHRIVKEICEPSDG